MDRSSIFARSRACELLDVVRTTPAVHRIPSTFVLGLLPGIALESVWVCELWRVYRIPRVLSIVNSLG
jgi:hypothetical protein